MSHLTFVRAVLLGALTLLVISNGPLIDNAEARSGTVKSPVLSEITYERKGLRHDYRIVRERATKTRSGLPSKRGYTLIFKETGRVPQRRSLTATEASFYSNAMNRILWANEYGSRKPSSTAPCRDYVRIKVVGDQTRICQENKKLTGQSYGLLNDLRANFVNRARN